MSPSGSSTLDLVSNGRVELGIGEASRVTELHPFDRRFRDKREVWEDAVRCLLPMFCEEGWEYHGEYFDFPLRNVVPKPRQKPHPPLWVACSQLDTIEMAGRRGMGALGFQFVSAEAAHAWVNAYYNVVHEAAREAVRLRDQPEHRRRVAVHVRDDRRGGQRQGRGLDVLPVRACVFYNTHGPVEPGTVNLWDEYPTWKADAARGRSAQRGGLIGSPDTIRRRLRKFEESNVDQVILLNQAGKNAHEDICASLELFAAR